MYLHASHITAQKQVLAPLMQESIGILLLPHFELVSAIEQEIQDNPLLEAEINSHKLKIDLYRTSAPLSGSLPDEDDPDMAPLLVHRPTLTDYLVQQLYLEMSQPQERAIGECIIGNMDQDGYLSMGVNEIAASLKVANLALVEEVLKAVQHFDPVGVAARDLKECLIIQLSMQNHPTTALAVQLIVGHFEDLAHKKYAHLAKKLKIALEDVQAAANLISKLNPYPARHWQNNGDIVYVQPDVFIQKNPAGDFSIELNRNGAPLLRINQFYCDLLKKPGMSQPEKDFVREKLTNAMHFIKSVQQRGQTLLSIARYIAEHQKTFLEGTGTEIAPMTLKDVATHLGRNESTISRAISRKYMDSPVGLLAFKFFFSNANYSIKEEIQGLIAQEDKNTPMSDQDIQEHFRSKGLTLARRTINKYRQVLQIPPSHQRKTSSNGNSRLANG